jgi:putative RNA 2'-phosphotransferase
MVLKNIYKCRVCGAFTESRIHCGVEAELLIDGRRRVMLSKLLSGLLRHYPWEAGLKPSSDGWVRIDDVVRGIREVWRNRELYQWVTREHVLAVAILDPKQRFEVRNGMIRARYGHSIDVNIEYPVEYPESKLYHGTSIDKLGKILLEGLKPMRRKYVHLTIDYEDAVETGRRHGKPAVLEISIECLRNRGIKLYRATKKIYLAKHIPPECIKQVIKHP